MTEGHTPTVGPKDGESFRTYVLKPRGITFHPAARTFAGRHFASIFRKEDYSDNYKHSRVWLNLSQDEMQLIAEQFEIGILLYQNEAYAERIAGDYLIRRDVLQRPTRSDTLVLTHYVCKWGLNPPKNDQPGYNMDFGPPTIGGTTARKPYTFNFNSDQTFMLSSSIFPPLVRNRLYDMGMQVGKGGLCPYLTFEMGKTADMHQTEAENRIAIASTSWLHRRCVLRARANQAVAGKLSERTLSGLSHYGIIIFGSSFSVWATHPVLKDGATGIGNEDSIVGYSISKLWQGGLDFSGGVRTYEAWQNWIHSWGLGPFLESVREDVTSLTTWGDEEGVSVVEGTAEMTTGI
ncbi:MAG: hypothetical protein M1840_004508 [Geoglossum simile]|nr:MAG: hypothetical protein M1840_004508 [Geoglossum simile]